jgi:hypothetical protein
MKIFRNFIKHITVMLTGLKHGKIIPKQAIPELSQVPKEVAVLIPRSALCYVQILFLAFI